MEEVPTFIMNYQALVNLPIGTALRKLNMAAGIVTLRMVAGVHSL